MGKDFWSHWSDGKAEVNGYDLPQPRYGQLRKGYAALIYVTEPFSRSKAVKVDRYDASNADHFIALKLNLVKRFQTGIYDYGIMSSIFTDPTRRFQTVKSTFSSQEWCGQVFEKLIVGRDQSILTIDSYFEGESATQQFKGPIDIEDAFWIQARGLDSGGPGTALTPKTILGSATLRRLAHIKAVTYTTTSSWSQVHTLQTPAGLFSVKAMMWRRQDGKTCQLHVETQRPFRIIGWECSDGEKARMTGSKRLPYWNQSRLADEALLKEIGLPTPRR